ncbi:MAG: ester cyclase, partial [Anaerolineaceae bacterium]|nr:ester cyclase [Anaerolineaceae bacterium]
MSSVFTPVDQSRNLANKRRVQAAWRDLTLAPLAQLKAVLAAVYSEDADFHGTHPVNDLSGRDAIRRDFLEPLRHALPDLERREGILAGGVYQGRELVACYGHYLGTFAQDWFDIPATRQILSLRFCEAHELVDGRISRSYVFIDYLDVMRQAGYWPLAPSLGREGVWQHPMSNDGVLLTPQD